MCIIFLAQVINWHTRYCFIIVQVQVGTNVGEGQTSYLGLHVIIAMGAPTQPLIDQSFSCPIVHTASGFLTF